MISDDRHSEILLTNIDHKDCGILAIQAITGSPRKRAYSAACDYSGYDPDIGVYRGKLEKAFHGLGYKTKAFPIDSGESVAAFAHDHQSGSYLVYIEKHVMALIDGDLHNSKGYWFDAVESVTQVFGPGNPSPPGKGVLPLDGSPSGSPFHTTCKNRKKGMK